MGRRVSSLSHVAPMGVSWDVIYSIQRQQDLLDTTITITSPSRRRSIESARTRMMKIDCQEVTAISDRDAIRTGAIYRHAARAGF